MFALEQCVYVTRQRGNVEWHNYTVPVKASRSKGYNVGWFKSSFFFRIFEINCFCFIVALFEILHDVEAIRGSSNKF